MTEKRITTDFERGIIKVILRKKLVDPSELLTGSIVKLFKGEITDNSLEIIFTDPKKYSACDFDEGEIERCSYMQVMVLRSESQEPICLDSLI